jgi:hypothetical protein
MAHFTDALGARGLANFEEPFNLGSQNYREAMREVMGRGLPKELLELLNPPVMPEVPVRQPVTVAADPDREYLTEYRRIAQKVGYRCSEVETRVSKAELLEFLQAEGIGVYNYKAVEEYMNGLVAKENYANRGWQTFTWIWASLRAKDRSFNLATLSQPSTYEKPIPFPVLLTIEKIADRFGDKVNLFVSDIVNVPKPDPFLAVSVAGDKEKYVIERWDEPGFRDR